MPSIGESLAFPWDFVHGRTQNENGSYNTRYLDCFMTFASCIVTEEEMDRLEDRHLCPERVLAQLVAQEKAAEAQTAH